MQILRCIALACVSALPLMAAGYQQKETAEPVPELEPLRSGMGAPATVSTQETEYPYYANTPAELLPFRDVEPYHRYWLTRLPFRGPGQEYPDPPNLTTLPVGLLSPAPYGPEGERGQRTRNGVVMAFDEANAARKPGQLPFELIERKDSPQWGSAANIAVEFSDMGVLGFLGTIDGDATHIALRASLKTEVYMINTSDPDPTLTETQIPWLTRVFPDDRQQCVRLADLVVRQHGAKRIVVFRESSRPGRVGVMHFIHYIRRLGYPPVQHLFFEPGDKNIGPQLSAIQAANPDAIVFYGQPDDVGRFAAQFREAGITARFFGFDRLKEDAFRENAGPAAEGTTIAYFFNPWRTDPDWVDFVERYQQRYGMRPDVYAAYGYDGARIMIEAIDAAGPNRWRIRDYLAGLDHWDGVTGRMIFDGRWDNIKPIAVAQFRNGQWHFESPTTGSEEPDPRWSRR
jgi:branched-chain amino acid transport system substrate-binding protein